MKPYPKLWWRIAGGCLLGLVATVAAGSVVAWHLLVPWPLVERPAQSVVTYPVETAPGVPADEEMTERVIAIMRWRIDPQDLLGMKWRAAGAGRMEVRMPVADLPPGTAPTGEAGDGRFGPERLGRLVGMGGWLEFRIVAGPRGLPLDPNTRKTYDALLAKRGPTSVAATDMPFAWFPVRGQDPKASAGLIVAEHDGRTWALLSAQAGDVMLPGREWRVVGACRGRDTMGRPAIDFELDAAGGNMLYKLTNSHKGQAMSIVLDGEVFSAPTIQSGISNRGQITGTFTAKEVDEYVGVLAMGLLRVRVTGRALSIQHISGGEPPQATTKRGLLMGLAVLAIAGVVAGFRAVVRSRVGAFGVWSILAAASGAGWWYAAAWNGFLPEQWPLRATIALALALLPLLIVWGTALLAAQRAAALTSADRGGQ